MGDAFSLEQRLQLGESVAHQVRPLYSAGLFGPSMHYCTAVFILNCVTLHTLLGAGLACLARHNVPHMGIIVGNRLQTVCICYELLYNWWAEVGPWQSG